MAEEPEREDKATRFTCVPKDGRMLARTHGLEAMQGLEGAEVYLGSNPHGQSEFESKLWRRPSWC